MEMGRTRHVLATEECEFARRFFLFPTADEL